MTGRTLVPWSLVVLLAGCSAAAPNDGAGAAAANPSWITGTWTGSIRATDKQSEFYKMTNICATFVADPNDKTDRPAGKFAFTYDQLAGTHTNGTFQGVGTTDVLLQPSDSNFSLVSQDVRLDLMYDVTATGLVLHNEDMRVVMGRTTAAAPGSSPTAPTTSGPVSTASTNLGGHWSCGDALGRTWLLFVKSDTAFDVEIRQAGSPTVIMSGAIALVAGDDSKDAILDVQSSNNPKAVGLELYGKLQGDVVMQLTVKSGEAMQCSKVLES